MLQSTLFTKTRKESPKDEVAKNADLLIRAGYIHKEMAGAYSYLPLGLRVLKKIENIIREEMNAIGGQEVLLTTLQDPALWKKSGRWDDAVMDNWFKTKLKNGAEVGIANTHEEPLTQILTHFVSSYKELPVYAYQFQTKFRNELRAKSGIMRGREFIMKDLYSFNKTEQESRAFYEQCADAYMKIFNRVGIGGVTYRTIASGGSFTAGLTDEFQTLCDAGEDIIYVDEEKQLAINKEVYSDLNLKAFGFDKKKLSERRSIEVGNIFPLGTKYSDALGLRYLDENGKKQSVHMGSYGIGLGRLLGTVVEVLSDDMGLVWPKSIAPFPAHLISLSVQNENVKKESDALYQTLQKQGIEVLYDDRDASAGIKFADAELIGISTSIIISEALVKKGAVEVKDRASGKTEEIKMNDVLKHIG